MLFGNPSVFAIIFEIVPEWSTSKHKNGLIGILAADRLIGNRLYKSSLGPELMRMRSVEHILENAPLISAFALTPKTIYQHLHDLSFGDKVTSPTCLISPWALTDAGDYLFVFKGVNSLDGIIYKDISTDEIIKLNVSVNIIAEVFSAALSNL